MLKMTEPSKTPLVEKIFERLLTTSIHFLEMKQNLEDIVKNVTNLAQSLVKLAQTVSVQRQDINALCESQQQIVEILKKNVRDSSYPYSYKKTNDEELN